MRYYQENFMSNLGQQSQQNHYRVNFVTFCPILVLGHHILDFFTNFSAIACHLIYSVLVGRVVILAGPKQLKAKAIETILALAPIIPGRSSTSILK
jgi:hypothetical protein